MLFNSGSFLCFLLLVLPTYWLLPSNSLRKLLLVGASFVFYAWWDWRFLGLFCFFIFFVFFGARLFLFQRRKRNPGPALPFFLCFPCLRLAPLCFFKYL